MSRKRYEKCENFPWPDIEDVNHFTNLVKKKGYEVAILSSPTGYKHNGKHWASQNHQENMNLNSVSKIFKKTSLKCTGHRYVWQVVTNGWWRTGSSEQVMANGDIAWVVNGLSMVGGNKKNCQRLEIRPHFKFRRCGIRRAGGRPTTGGMVSDPDQRRQLCLGGMGGRVTNPGRRHSRTMPPHLHVDLQNQKWHEILILSPTEYGYGHP